MSKVRTRTTKDGSIVLEADEPFYARCLLCRTQFNGDLGKPITMRIYKHVMCCATCEKRELGTLEKEELH